MKQPEVIFFDIVGTLASGPGWTARERLREDLGLCEKEAKKASRLLMTAPSSEPEAVASALQKLLPRIDPERIGPVVGRMWAEQAAGMREIEGATRLLRLVKNRNVRLGILSNCWEPAFAGFCRACPEILPLIDHWILSYRSRCKKPGEAIFTLALEACGRPACACWIVGDTFEQDILPARELGFYTVWVLSRPERERTALARILRGQTDGPHLAVASLRELDAIVEGF